ncbi:pectate lyase-like [Nicotiana tomentosiformis]|uniref:Pectate lyase n=1 Tax=Nicotiana tabacum TaxID=4097 RepID=A0A1S4BBN9_TOBAC|nr:pectate lyase-like [Nicotiana tomentosiformis]XP_016486309.1 PREDICTED: pectate lyase-like isoform X1 [Nicotiana tabacum]XP_016486310.1 PREDICTED: pectate lyase-like isoform X2 [Nicotiana tabacum]
MGISKTKINGLIVLLFFTFVAVGTAVPDNSTRRHLSKKYKGPCVAANLIDKCWRCDPRWADNRQKYADCAMGFGRTAIGGKGGRIYVVTDPSDNNVENPVPGTLRHAVIQKEPLWIIFSKHMKIKLNRELLMQSYKTIDARGHNVHIENGAGIKMQGVNNIIITNLHIHNIGPSSGGMIRDSIDHIGIRGADEGDAISIFASHDIWIDHVSMSRAADGLIDAVQGSTGITISNCHFTDHDKVMLFGANDNYLDDKKMQITLAYNHFGKRLDQRMPRCRLGFFHLVNNDYTHWMRYAIGGSSEATIISQGNRFIAQHNVDIKEVTHREKAQESEWRHWTWLSRDDDMQNGAFFRTSGDPNALSKFKNLNLMPAEPSYRVGILTKFSGSLGCTVGRPC